MKSDTGYLQHRCSSIAESWYQAIAHTSFVSYSSIQVRHKLTELTEQIIALITDETLDHEKARNIGAGLAQLGYLQPEALAGTQESLTREFFRDLPVELVATLQPRFAMLLGRMASGFFQAALAQVLTQQEQIRNALIAARQRAERVLRENETRYRAISELASDVAYGLCVEPDGALRREWVTEAFTRITGYTLEELDARGGWLGIVHPDDVDGLRQRAQLFLAGQTHSCEYRIITKSGEVRWLRDRARPEREARSEHHDDQPPSVAANGRIEHIIGAASDITERKQAEEALRESETLYRSLVETSPDSIAVTDLDANFVICNRQAARLYGAQSPEDLLETSTFDLIAPEDRARALDNTRKTLETGLISNVEYTLLRKDGSSFPAEMSASLIRDAEGKPKAFIAVMRDITQRKRAEQAEREQRLFAEALRDTAAALNSTLELDQVLDAILSNLERVVPHDTANIMLTDATRQVACVVRSRGYAERGVEQNTLARPFKVAETPGLRQMTESGLPLVVPDIMSSANRDSWAETTWIRSYAGAPIRSKGQIAGFLNVNSETPGFYQPAQAERLLAFADQAAIAIENARLYEATRRNVERLTQLHEAAEALALASSVDDLYREIVRRAVRFVNAHASNLAVFDGEEHLVSVAVENMPDYIMSSRVKLGEGLSGRAAMLRQPQYVQNYATLEKKQQAAIVMQMTLVAVVALPLVWQDRLVGTLGITDNREREFDADDMHVLTSFATLVAAALEQRRAVAAIQAREAEARMLTARLAHVQEEERARLAAQLHDSIGYHLVTLQKNTESLQSEFSPDDPLHRRLMVSTTLLQETQQRVNSLEIDLDIKQLNAIGLDPAARQYIDRLCTAGCPISVRVTGHVQRLPADVERVAFRTLQEALTNAVRHAEAARILVHLHFGRKSLQLNVQDNGHGFDPAALENSPATALGGLRRQAQTLGGALTVQSERGKGTWVTLHIPFKSDARNQLQASVLLVGPHDLIRRGLRLALVESGDFTCIGEASDDVEALHHVELNQPDMVLMDVKLPDHSGIEITRQITRRFPQVRVVILSYTADDTYLEQALHAGAKGFLLASDDSQQIIEGLRSVVRGEFAVSPRLSAAWARLQRSADEEDAHEPITSREREVLVMIAAGYSNRMIADEMGISRRTVEVHRRNLKAKLKTRNSAQMIQSAIQLGLISVRP